MDIFINSEKSPALIQTKATGSPLSGFKVKLGAVVPLRVTVLGAQNATGLRMGIKAKGHYEGDLLILAEAAAGAQTKLGTRFDRRLQAIAKGRGSFSPRRKALGCGGEDFVDGGHGHN